MTLKHDTHALRIHCSRHSLSNVRRPTFQLSTREGSLLDWRLKLGWSGFRLSGAIYVLFNCMYVCYVFLINTQIATECSTNSTFQCSLLVHLFPSTIWYLVIPESHSSTGVYRTIIHCGVSKKHFVVQAK